MDSDRLRYILKKAVGKCGVRQMLVLPGDRLLNINCEVSPIALIANTSPHYISSYGHWVGIFINNNKAEYFNSYGPATLSKIGINLPKCVTELIDISVDAQDSNSRVCGLYSVFWLYLKARGYGNKYFKSLFSENTKKLNDKRVIKFYRQFKVKIRSGGQVCTSKSCNNV